MNKLIVSFTCVFSLLVLVCVSPFVIAQDDEDEFGNGNDDEYVIRHNKLHMLLVNGKFVPEIKENAANLIKEVSNRGFLDKKASESGNPLAPCSLLAGALISAKVYWLPYSIRRGRFPTPISDSHIFGLYDDAVVKRGFYKQPAEIQADILARLHIYWSGGFDSETTSFVHEWKQRQCLNYLLSADPGTFLKKMQKQSPFRVLTHAKDHYAFTDKFGSTYEIEQIDQYLQEVKKKESLTLYAKQTTNPAMPCGLLGGYNMAESMMNLWQSINKGTLSVPKPNTPFIGKYLELMKGGRIPTDDPVIAAELAAGYFANAILYTDSPKGNYNTYLLQASTQRSCLSQITGHTRSLRHYSDNARIKRIKNELRDLDYAKDALGRNNPTAAYRLLEDRLVSEYPEVKQRCRQFIQENPEVLSAAKETFTEQSLKKSIANNGKLAREIEEKRLSIYKTVASDSDYKKARLNFDSVFGLTK